MTLKGDESFRQWGLQRFAVAIIGTRKKKIIPLQKFVVSVIKCASVFR